MKNNKPKQCHVSKIMLIQIVKSNKFCEPEINVEETFFGD